MLGSAFVLLAAAMRLRPCWLGHAPGRDRGGHLRRHVPAPGVADITNIAGLKWLAFDILGHEIELVLPDVVGIWFAALLLTGTSGLTRYLGWAIVPNLFGLEIGIVVGRFVGIDVPFVKATILLPFHLPARRERQVGHG